MATWAIPTNLASQDEGSYQVQLKGAIVTETVLASSEFQVLGFVVPEVPLGTFGAMAFLLAGLLLFVVKKRAVSLPRP